MGSLRLRDEPRGAGLPPSPPPPPPPSPVSGFITTTAAAAAPLRLPALAVVGVRAHDDAGCCSFSCCSRSSATDAAPTQPTAAARTRRVATHCEEEEDAPSPSAVVWEPRRAPSTAPRAASSSSSLMSLSSAASPGGGLRRALRALAGLDDGEGTGGAFLPRSRLPLLPNNAAATRFSSQQREISQRGRWCSSWVKNMRNVWVLLETLMTIHLYGRTENKNPRQVWSHEETLRRGSIYDSRLDMGDLTGRSGDTRR